MKIISLLVLCLFFSLPAWSLDGDRTLTKTDKEAVSFLEGAFPIKFHFFDSKSTNPYDDSDGSGKTYRACVVEFLKDVNGILNIYDYGSNDSQSFNAVLLGWISTYLSQDLYWRQNKPAEGLSPNGVKYMNNFVRTWSDVDRDQFSLRYWEGDPKDDDSLSSEDIRVLDEVFPERKIIRKQIDDLNDNLKVVRERFYH